MGQILSLQFQYKDRTYYSLLRVKEKEMYKEYHITIMQNELNSWLNGKSIITEINGALQVNLPPADEELGRLILQVAEELGHYLHLGLVIQNGDLDTADTAASIA